jgi:glycerol-3-phosphate acyltransferase PlsX
VDKSHGGTDALGFATAIDMAVEMVRTGLVAKIRTDVELMTGLLKESDAHSLKLTEVAP